MESNLQTINTARNETLLFLLLDPMKDTHIKAGMLKSQLQASKQRAQYSEHIIRIVLMEYSTAATTTPPQNLKKPE